MLALPMTSDAEWFSMKMITNLAGAVALTGEAEMSDADGDACEHAARQITTASGASLRIVWTSSGSAASHTPSKTCFGGVHPCPRRAFARRRRDVTSGHLPVRATVDDASNRGGADATTRAEKRFSPGPRGNLGMDTRRFGCRDERDARPGSAAVDTS